MSGWWNALLQSVQPKFRSWIAGDVPFANCAISRSRQKTGHPAYRRVISADVWWVGVQVYSAFRGGGGERRLKQEVAGAVATQAARGATSRV